MNETINGPYSKEIVFESRFEVIGDEEEYVEKFIVDILKEVCGNIEGMGIIYEADPDATLLSCEHCIDEETTLVRGKMSVIKDGLIITNEVKTV